MNRTLCALLLPLALAACNQIPGNIESAAQKQTAAPRVAKAGDDVVVIAVLDGNINPYHWDYLQAKMPQHNDAGASNDLPLDQDPATWLPGHPGASAFKSYQALPLTLNADKPETSTTSLHDRDIEQWEKIINSEGNNNTDVNYYWFPGTKIVGHVSFNGSGPEDTWAASSHGIGTSSVSTGNIHGTCPHCVLVFVHGAPEIAQQWVAQQDWIDLQTNSYGSSLNSDLTCIAPADAACGAVRDLIYAQSDTELQRQTVERGQSIFFSGGNGVLNDFSITHTNLFSSQKGPDWIVTVGAIAPADGASFSGHGRPADISSLGDGYPSAAGTADHVTNEGDFGGTSNASPVIAGLYGEALYRIRKAIGSARMQRDGVIAEGKAGCQAANANCALADGKLTVHELREALFRSARYTEAGVAVGSSLVGVYTEIPMSSSIAELELLSEGHGSLMGKFKGEENYEEEVSRITGFADGSWFEEQDADQRDWMVADSVCRQGGWGAWEFGYAPQFPAPAPSPEWPVRTWLTEVCPEFLGNAVMLQRTLPSPLVPQ